MDEPILLDEYEGDRVEEDEYEGDIVEEDETNIDDLQRQDDLGEEYIGEYNPIIETPKQSQLERLKRTKVDAYYNLLEQIYPDIERPDVIFYDDFKYIDNVLYANDIRLTQVRDKGSFLKLRSLRNVNIKNFKTRILNLRDNTPDTLPTLQHIQEEIPTENIPMNDQPQVATNIDDTIQQEMQNIFDNTPDMQTQTSLDMRELLGLDKALQRIKGEHVNNLSKLSELDKNILTEEENKAAAQRRGNKTTENEISNRLKDLELERKARLETLKNNNQNHE